MSRRIPQAKYSKLLEWQKRYDISADSFSALVEIVATRRRDGACITCRCRKIKCLPSPDDADHCASCIDVPQLCLRTQLSQTTIFDKWADPSYKAKLNWNGLHGVSRGTVPFSVHHFLDGPCLQLQVFEFVPTDEEQITVYTKVGALWMPSRTWPLALGGVDQSSLSEYIDASSRRCVTERTVPFPLPPGCPFGRSDLTDQALILLGATELLIRGWNMPGMSSEMPHMPRVLQNQLDSYLELFIVSRERSLLDAIQDSMKDSQSSRENVTLAILTLFLVIEKDIWRLMHWQLFPAQLYKWRHPMSPKMLMEKALFLADVLLAHLRALGSLSPNPMSVAPRILYNADNDESLTGSLLQRAFEPMTVEQYVVAHSPRQLFMLNSDD